MSVTISHELEEKRDRILTSGSLTVLWFTAGKLRAVCRSESGRTYRLTRDGTGPLRCSCKAAEYGRPCSHALAAALVLDLWPDSEAAA